MPATPKLPSLDTAALCLADWLTSLNGPGDDAHFVKLSHGDALICLCATNCRGASEPNDVKTPGYGVLREEADRLEHALDGRAKIMFYLARKGHCRAETLSVCTQLMKLLRRTSQYAALMVANQDTEITERGAMVWT